MKLLFMYIPKRYGQSKIDECPFCSKNAVTENPQGVPVCANHKDKLLDLKCQCGCWLEVRKGKWGPYFNCINCGNISFKLGLEMNKNLKDKSIKQDRQIPAKQTYKVIEETKEKVVITSDELDFYYT